MFASAHCTPLAYSNVASRSLREAPEEAGARVAAGADADAVDVTGGVAAGADSPALHALTASSPGSSALRNAGNLRNKKCESAIATSLANRSRQVRPSALKKERCPPLLL
ncbi:hypothetical protein VDF70_17800 [Xanthomonas campestris pv. raphani]|uniref:hypothetical protein n=1 Tax=Xanthomonas campestris TaxID=339 RepID=UPI002B221B9C|nr:hypothetical protein [Xanthomonas campestris]MEA9760863.1 hypothetical protein [Xanthomonas campestris pv. raphani]